jgi:hypothetical protein
MPAKGKETRPGSLPALVCAVHSSAHTPHFNPSIFLRPALASRQLGRFVPVQTGFWGDLMLDQTATLLWLIVFSAAFALAGVLYARHYKNSLEDFVVARNSQSSVATILTLLASSLGAWILFSPAQAATWGGLSAVIGYALGSMSPRLAMIPLGKRMRELLPRGHSLSEFVIARYGRPMYALTLLIMLFYMFISMTAEITAMSKMITLIAPIPLWVTAGIVLLATLIYTSYGGLRASIFTDKVQMLVILPMLFLIIMFGWQAVGGPVQLFDSVKLEAPRLIELGDPVGIKAGLTFFVAILLTGLFHQGNWQRIYAAKDTQSMRRGFLLGGLFVAPFIFLMGLFGLAFVGLGSTGDSSVALFNVIFAARTGLVSGTADSFGPVLGHEQCRYRHQCCFQPDCGGSGPDHAPSQYRSNDESGAVPDLGLLHPCAVRVLARFQCAVPVPAGRLAVFGSRFPRVLWFV